MSKNQKGINRKQRKEKRKKGKKEKSRQERAAYQAQKKQHSMTNAWASTAFCWPIRYRALFFDHLPELSANDLSFAGVDLHMKWYQSQEDRRNDVGSEVVSALRIETCQVVAKPGVASSNTQRLLKCSGALSSQVSSNSDYGRWYRMQWQAHGSVPDGEEYFDLPVEFTLRLAKFTPAQAKRQNQFQRSIDSVPYIAKAWNVAHIDIPKHIGLDGNALVIDRLVEMLFMLRIWTPMLSSERFEVPLSEQKLREELALLEQKEKAAGEVLKQYSDQSMARYKEMDAAFSEMIAAQNAIAEKKQVFEEHESRFKELQEEDASSSAAREARKRMNIARDAYLAEMTHQEPLVKDAEARKEKAEKALAKDLESEFDHSSAFTRPFLHRQRVLAWLSRV